METRKIYSVLLSGAIVLFAAGGTAKAQPSVSIGPKIGASFSGFRGDDAGHISMRKGVAGGLFLNISPLKFLSIQPELLLQQKGAVNENQDFNFIEDVKLGYLNVPVLVKLRVPIAGTFFPHVYAGPQFSYAFSSEYSIRSLDGGAMTREINLRDYDLSGVFGFGLDVEIRHLFITGDLRYALGVLNLTNDEEVQLKNKDLVLLIGLGYKF